jgi:hypothetical protein
MELEISMKYNRTLPMSLSYLTQRLLEVQHHDRGADVRNNRIHKPHHAAQFYIYKKRGLTRVKMKYSAANYEFVNL